MELDRIQDKETYTSHIDLGNVPIVKITTSSNEIKMIAHLQDMDYAYRGHGQALKKLSLVEYACINEVVKHHCNKKKKPTCW